MQPYKEFLWRHIPPQHRMRVLELKQRLCGGFRRWHYSQFGEDVVLSTLLTTKRGFYVDVGANHPKRYSNTALLHERGWRGINIEPNTEAIRRFRALRPSDTNLACGISAAEGSLTYYRFSDPAVNTFSAEVAKGLRAKRWLVELPSESVPTFPLRSILEQQVPRGTTIDFLNVDVEGYDLDVLLSNDWSRFAPTVVAVEDHSFVAERPTESAIYTFLHEHGYRLAAHVGPTLIHIQTVHPDAAQRAQAQAKSAV